MANATNWDKFLLLLWKNWTIQKRHKCQTLFEILIPVLCFSIVLLIRYQSGPTSVTTSTKFEPQSVDLLDRNDFPPAVEFLLAYSPQNSVLDRIVKRAAESLKMTSRGYPNAKSLEVAMINSSIFAGVEFDDSLASINSAPKKLKFALRFPAELRVPSTRLSTWNTKSLMVPFSPSGLSSPSDEYLDEGFLAVQSALSKSVIQEFNPNLELPNVFTNRYPYPPHEDDPVLAMLEQVLPWIMLFSFFYPCIVMVKHITAEKEKQLKESMKIMGLSSWLQWSAWFAKNMLLLVFSISLITVLLCVPLMKNTSILRHSDWTVVWFFLFVYSIATVCFCFMVSVFFNKVTVATRLASLLWMLSIVPFRVISTQYDSLSTLGKIGINLLSNTAMSLGMRSTIHLEANQQGLRWHSMINPVTIEELNVRLVIVMLLVDALLYLAIALYVEQVMPGEYGVAKPWYFPFVSKCFRRKQMSVGFRNQDTRYFEADPVTSNPGIQIRNLRKVFNRSNVAVHGLNLNMYEDQITILLGHNGAGKTTTMSMLTGMFSPTSGTAYLSGHDIRTDIEGVRQSLGLCPQHNVLFDELTVSEHLRFFARLKGVPRGRLNYEIEKYLQILELTGKRHAQSHTLAGGMKRRLAVGVALCGGSKVVLLDEPTSGMDPSARRALWDLLQQEKKHRTILLSTHFMDEADVLGDRIAIMSGGVLKAVGTPFFLKKSFGTGYRLICVKGPNCDKQLVLDLLRKYIPDVRIDTDIGSELSFVLKEDYIRVFQPMLEYLESRMEMCGITSYGISLTTMEEVFLKAGSDSPNQTSVETSVGKPLRNLDLYTGRHLLLSQVKGQLLKKYLSCIRSWGLLIGMFTIPIFFVISTFLSMSSNQNHSPLTMSLDPYVKTVTVVGGTPDTSKIVQTYMKLIDNVNGMHSSKEIDSNMNDFILQRSADSISEVNSHYMVGATFNANNYTAWFNYKGYHTAPLALSLLYNAVLQTECPTCELTVVNKPLPSRVDPASQDSGAGLNLVINTVLAMAFVSAMFVLFYINERTSRAKLLQFVSGTNAALYWTVAFGWDLLLFGVISLVYVITLAAFQEEGWSTFSELGRVYLLFVFFGVGFLPLIYISSFVFSSPGTAYALVMLFKVVTGAVFFGIVVIWKAVDSDVGVMIEWIFMLFPSFALTHALSQMSQLASIKLLCQDCDLPDLLSFHELGIARNLLCLAVIGVAVFLIVLAIEYRIFNNVMNYFMIYKSPQRSLNEDPDVTAEKELVLGMTQNDINSYNLVLRSATKYYGRFLAVNNLSVAIDRYECFGLLGINGAGKTTTFKMMTGDVRFSSGVAWVEGISLQSSMGEVYQRIGYCPQFDALLDDLTGRETLRIYALLRGVRAEDIRGVTLTLAEDLNFLKHIDKKTKQYSGGNKRKLSTAIALMGNPSVVYLDEPTTGMDPGAKRQLWNVICKARSTGKSIVLTSHSMEECEALCTRLAIMVNGEFKCLGSTQHLKNKFSKGFLLMIKVKKVDDPKLQLMRLKEVKFFVGKKLPGSVLKEEYQDSLNFHIPQSDLKWSAMFGLMEAHKEQLNIEDYSLGQTTLEQVFLSFTKYQLESD
ncbi:phospholipid-transporting ATPase ABCA3-like [Culex pipiens pallens]|uniref:phospholipid-transporting ATPase ABCA3-like n=1 Tax=Culex pipiens pallens TaxID=42434 RepID=UPI001952D7DC|nr:phospholipid-transporting ATPase ABCA3-like [Culex pipiens pallens]